MNRKTLIHLHKIFLDILKADVLEDAAQYSVEDLMLRYSLPTKQAIYLENLIRNAMNS